MDSYLFDELFHYLNYMLIKLKRMKRKSLSSLHTSTFLVIRKYLKILKFAQFELIPKMILKKHGK